jgi:hypothetical protein
MKQTFEWDWAKIPIGSTFTANIEEIKTSGRIFKHGTNIYLCQNKKDGCDSPNKLGFKYSWIINRGTAADLSKISIDVSNLNVYLPEKGYEIPDVEKSIGRYTVQVDSEKVTVGCTPVPFKRVEQIYKKMVKLRKYKIS